MWKLADFQNNGGLVLGSGTNDWRKIDFLKQEMEFRIGARVSQGQGQPLVRQSVPPACPGSRRIAPSGASGLHAGDVVTTGAWTGLEIAKAGDEVVARFPGIGEATVKFG